MVFANILILSGSEKCLLTCFMQILFFFEHLATTSVLYESDNGVKSDFFSQTIYMWLFIGHMLAAG